MSDQDPDMDGQDPVEHEPAQAIVNEPDVLNPAVEDPVVGQMENAIPVLHEVDVYAVNDVVLAEDLAGDMLQQNVAENVVIQNDEAAPDIPADPGGGGDEEDVFEAAVEQVAVETVPEIITRPYCFRRQRDPPPSLYSLCIKAVLARYIPIPDYRKPLYVGFRGRGQEKYRRQMERYFGVLPDHLKHDLQRHLFGGRWSTYRQAHRTKLDREMYENELCCTYPEECTGCHTNELQVAKQENVFIWKILQGKHSTSLDMLPFMESYHHNFMFEDLLYNSGTREIFRDNQLRDIECEIAKNSKLVAQVQQLMVIGTYRELNSPLWTKLMTGMPNLQSLELHFWSGDNFFKIIKDVCVNLRELILSRQRQSKFTKDLELIPAIIRKFSQSLRVFILDSRDKPFSQKISKDIQKALSECAQLECLKLESEESPYLHWCNSRYRVKTKKLMMTLRRSSKYRTIVRNVNRCFNPDVDIDLFFDTYVDIDNHKHAFFSQGPLLGGGENTVSQATRTFEAKEVGGQFYKLMAEFGPKVSRLSAETDIRPEYFMYMFPNLEYLEMFARASRKVPIDPRFKENHWSKLTGFALEVDPGFSALTAESLIVNILGDVFAYSNNVSTLKVLASQSGLKVSETSLLLKLRQVRGSLAQLTHIEFLSPYCISNSGLTAQLAEFFLDSCPQLEVLRDVASWTGTPEAWQGVAERAERRGLYTGWAQKTKRCALYTIDYDAEGWIQNDTGHEFELYNNLNDDSWEVVDNNDMVVLGVDLFPEDV